MPDTDALKASEDAARREEYDYMVIPTWRAPDAALAPFTNEAGQ